MIRNENELALSRTQLRRVEAALDDLHKDVMPKNERLYHTMAEGYIDLLLELRGEIDAYRGIEPRPTVAAPSLPAADAAPAPTPAG